MKNKIVKFGSFLGLTLVGVAVSTSSYVANSAKTGAVAINNQAAGLKATTNDNYKVLWDNPDPSDVANYNTKFMFNSGKVSDKSELMATFSDDDWENVIKKGDFYLDFYAEKEKQGEETEPTYHFKILVMDSWWQNQQEYTKDSTSFVKLDDTTFCHTLRLNLSQTDLPVFINERNLVIGGGGFIPQRIYYGTKPDMTSQHYVNVAKRASSAFKNHAYITVDNETAFSGTKVIATVNYVNPDSSFEYTPHVKKIDNSEVTIQAQTGNTFSFEMPDEDVYITADFKDNFTVTFSMKGHGRNGYEPQIHKCGEKVVQPTEYPVDEYGFVFLGWFNDITFSKEWDFNNDQVTCDTTIFLKWREVLRLQVNDNGAKTNYEVGEDFDVSNLQLQWTYNKQDEYQPDFQPETKYQDIQLSMVNGYDKYKSGAQTVNIWFNGRLAPFYITVADFDVALKSKPAKLEYNLGGALDLTGAKLTLTPKSDAAVKEIDVTPEMVSGYDKDKVGKQTITVTLDGKTVTFDVTVAEQPTPTPTSGGISTGALVGAIIGSLVGGAAIALGIGYLILKKKKAQ